MSGVTRSFPARLKNKVARMRNPRPAQDERVPRLRQQVKQLSTQVTKLNGRVTALEAELMQANSQGRRVGEISDLVTELLVSEASRRDPEFQRILDKYASDRRS